MFFLSFHNLLVGRKKQIGHKTRRIVEPSWIHTKFFFFYFHSCYSDTEGRVLVFFLFFVFHACARWGQRLWTQWDPNRWFNWAFLWAQMEWICLKLSIPSRTAWCVLRAVNANAAECICGTLTEQPPSWSLPSSLSQPHRVIKADTWQPSSWSKASAHSEAMGPTSASIIPTLQMTLASAYTAITNAWLFKHKE